MISTPPWRLGLPPQLAVFFFLFFNLNRYSEPVNKISEFFLLFFFCTFVFMNAPAADDFRIVIDPGHGGADLGATRDSFVESKIVLQISKLLKQELENLNIKDVYLTREKDESLSLKERVAKANQIGADLFVSLHANTSSQPLWTGMEFYFNANSRPVNEATPLKPTNNEVVSQIQKDFRFYEKTERSLELSKSVQMLAESTEQKSIIKRAPFYVIENTEMPSVLIELGFISNRREAQKLTESSYQKELAKLIAKALLSYKEKSDKDGAL
jgi:N-acetylmuramoyl-L-alanine amidase